MRKILRLMTVNDKLDCVWNVMAQAQKSDFVFLWSGRVHLNLQGCQFSRLLAARGVRISGNNGSNAGYTMFRGSVKGAGYPLHSPVSPSLPLPCVTVCHHVWNGLYHYPSWKHTRSRSLLEAFQAFGVCVIIQYKIRVSLNTNVILF
jgi:hypothetical protein